MLSALPGFKNLNFIVDYFTEYGLNRRAGETERVAYYDLSFEEEARAMEKRIIGDLNARYPDGNACHPKECP